MPRTDTASRPSHGPVQALGWGLALSLAVVFAFCALVDRPLSRQGMVGFRSALMPWVDSLNLSSFALWPVLAVPYGSIVAPIFAPLHGQFVPRAE